MSDADSTQPVRIEPNEDATLLRIVWRDGHVSEYEPRVLRLHCRCAGCVDEFTGEPILVPASVPADIHPRTIRYVGRYALSFEWSDGHATGIYPFEYLRSLDR